MKMLSGHASGKGRTRLAVRGEVRHVTGRALFEQYPSTAPIAPVPPRQRTYFARLPKPLRLRFTYDEASSKIFVHKLLPDCDATTATLLQPGDWLLRIDDHAPVDGRWDKVAIQELVRDLESPRDVSCVLERPRPLRGSRPAFLWHACGRAGIASSALPIEEGGGDREVLVALVQPKEQRPRGRTLYTTFHRSNTGMARYEQALRRPEAWRAVSRLCMQHTPLLLFPSKARAGPQAAVQVLHPSAPSSRSHPQILPSAFPDADTSNIAPLTTPRHPPQPLAQQPIVRAAMPWLLVAIGPFAHSEITTIAIEFGLSQAVEVTIAADTAGRPHLAGPKRSVSAAPATDSPLDALISCTTSIHRSALAAGLTSRTANCTSRHAVLLRCELHSAVGATATALAAYFLWFGHVAEAEACAMARQALNCSPEMALVRRATAKLCRESHFRARTYCLKWPYGGDEVCVVAEMLQERLRSCSGSQERLLWRTRSSGAGQKVRVGAGSDGNEVVAPLWEHRGSSALFTKAAGPGHTFFVRVQPHRRETRVRYVFEADGVTSVDPALPVERALDGSVANILTVASIGCHSGPPLPAARAEVARRMRRAARRARV